MSSTTGEWERKKGEWGRWGAAETGRGIMKRKWRCAETKDEACWERWDPHAGILSEGFHRRKSMNE